MPERLETVPFWDQWVNENLRKPENPYHNEVWLISGLKGVGKTDVCNRIMAEARKNGVPIEYYNPGQQIIEEYQMVTGTQLTGFNVRPDILNKRYDTQLAKRFIDPQYSHTIQLIDSRLGGVIAAEITMAATQQGKLDYLPVSFHSVLMYADDQTRRLALMKAGVETNLEDYDAEEERNFEQFKKERGIVNLHAPFLTIGNIDNPAYTLYYDSGLDGEDALKNIADDIWGRINANSVPILAA